MPFAIPSANQLDSQSKDSSIFRGASADYGVKSSGDLLGRGVYTEGRGNNAAPFEKKSSVFRVITVNPWWACLPIY